MCSCCAPFDDREHQAVWWCYLADARKRSLHRPSAAYLMDDDGDPRVLLGHRLGPPQSLASFLHVSTPERGLVHVRQQTRFELIIIFTIRVDNLNTRAL